MMIMIMAMIIMRKNEGGTYQRSWKSTPLVMDKARGGVLCWRITPTKVDL